MVSRLADRLFASAYASAGKSNNYHLLFAFDFSTWGKPWLVAWRGHHNSRTLLGFGWKLYFHATISRTVR